MRQRVWNDHSTSESESFYISPKISFQKRKDLVLESLQTPNSDAWGEPHAYDFFKKYVFRFLSFCLPFIQQEPQSTLEH